MFLESYDPSWSLPIPVTTLAAYGVFLHEEGFKPGTVRTHLAGIGWRHKVKGFQDPSKQFLIARLLAGMVKNGPPVKQATPIRLSLLTRFVNILPEVVGHEESGMFQAAFLLAYYASLRASEYVVTGGSAHTWQLANVAFRRSKEDRLSLQLCLPSYKASERAAKLLVPPSDQDN